MKYLAFDIEIVKEIPEGEDWEDIRPLGISCAATLRSDDPNPLLWYPGYKDNVYPQRGAMSQIELLELVVYMSDMSKRGFTPLTWNGLKFDFDILAEESKEWRACTALALKHIDMMFNVVCYKGFPLSLKSAAEGMNLSGKAEGMSGALVPSMWADDNEKLVELGRQDLADMPAMEKRNHVVNYVGLDAVATLQIAQACDKKKALYWTSKKDRPQTLHLSDGWLTVQRALKLPRPNTSWMSNPMKREDFTAWFEKAKGSKRAD